MDGTKPNMDSNAEENQDEGQESKGTPRQRGFFFLRISVSLWRHSRLRLPERFTWLLSATSYQSSKHTLAGSAYLKRSAKTNQ